MESRLTDVTRVIQLAVAPVFLLTAIATMINALNTRLGRIVDRRRVVQERLHARSDYAADPATREAFAVSARQLWRARTVRSRPCLSAQHIERALGIVRAGYCP